MRITIETEGPVIRPSRSQEPERVDELNGGSAGATASSPNAEGANDGVDAGPPPSWLVQAIDQARAVSQADFGGPSSGDEAVFGGTAAPHS